MRAVTVGMAQGLQLSTNNQLTSRQHEEHPPTTSVPSQHKLHAAIRDEHGQTRPRYISSTFTGPAKSRPALAELIRNSYPSPTRLSGPSLLCHCTTPSRWPWQGGRDNPDTRSGHRKRGYEGGFFSCDPAPRRVACIAQRKRLVGLQQRSFAGHGADYRQRRAWYRLVRTIFPRILRPSLPRGCSRCSFELDDRCVTSLAVVF
jgi:hypothetical protein